MLFCYVNAPKETELSNLDYRSPCHVYEDSPRIAYDSVIGLPDDSEVRLEIELPVCYWVPLSMLNRCISSWQVLKKEMESKLEDETLKNEDWITAWWFARDIAIANIHYHTQCREEIRIETEKIGTDAMDDETSLKTLNEWVYRQTLCQHASVVPPDCPARVLEATAKTLAKVIRGTDRRKFL